MKHSLAIGPQLHLARLAADDGNRLWDRAQGHKGWRQLHTAVWASTAHANNRTRSSGQRCKEGGRGCLKHGYFVMLSRMTRHKKHKKMSDNEDGTRTTDQVEGFVEDHRVSGSNGGQPLGAKLPRREVALVEMNALPFSRCEHCSHIGDCGIKRGLILLDAVGTAATRTLPDPQPKSTTTLFLSSLLWADSAAKTASTEAGVMALLAPPEPALLRKATFILATVLFTLSLLQCLAFPVTLASAVVAA